MTAAFAHGRDVTFLKVMPHPLPRSVRPPYLPALYRPAPRCPDHMGKLPLGPQTGHSFCVPDKCGREAEAVVPLLPSFESLHFDY